MQLNHVAFGSAGVPYGRSRRIACRRLLLKQSVVAVAEKQEQSDNILVRGTVSALTEVLRFAGVGGNAYQTVVQQDAATIAPDLVPGDVAGLMAVLRTDFTDKAYFITGSISDHIYAQDCFFADPTVKFSGLAKWKRNLQLLVPFLVDPAIELKSLRQSEPTPEGCITLRATWRLKTYLRFWWMPLIDIEGGTDYELNADGNKIVRHVEFWSVSGVQAIAMMFVPSGKEFVRQ